MSRLLYALLEIPLHVFSIWTVVYHASFLAGLPAFGCILVFLLLTVVLALRLRTRWQKALKFGASTLSDPQERRFLAGLLTLSLACGLFTLVVNRSDADDFTYFHRAVLQLDHLDRPFFRTNTGHNVEGLPDPSTIHTMHSYEPFAAIAAKAFGIEPLWAYQNLSAFFVAGLLPVVYFLLYRQLRMGRETALACTVGALVFLLLDGNLKRSFGNFTLMRCWQGKSILAALLLPMTMLFTLRLLFRPTLRSFVPAGLCVIAAIGLSSSGIFLAPGLIFCLLAAYVLTYGVSRRRLRRALLGGAASFYGLAIIAALLLGILASPPDSRVWTDRWPTAWNATLALATGGVPSLVRDALILLALPLAALRSPLGLLPGSMAALFVLFFANPVMGPLWHRLLTPAAQWRLYYLLPLPWCAGLAVSLVGDGARWKRFRWGCLAAVVLSLVVSFRHSVFSTPYDPPLLFKYPWAYKLPPQEFAFSKSIAGRLSGRNLLAPEDVAMIVSMLNPTVRLETTRTLTTELVFRIAGKEAEGHRRLMARALVSAGGKADPSGGRAFLESLDDGVDAVVFRKEAYSWGSAVLKSRPSPWLEAARSDSYILFLKQI